MIAFLRNAALCAAVGLGALAAPAGAWADDSYVRIGNGQAPYVQVQSSESYRRYDHRPNYRPDYRPGFRPGMMRGCTDYDALIKAKRMGLRQARIARASRQVVTVRGRAFGERATITFARAPRCPVIR